LIGNRTIGVILAAGLSSRFPGDKLLHPLGGRPLAAHIADTLLELPLFRPCAVCPAGNAARIAIFRSRGYDIVLNDAPERGMASSLALAAQRALELDADALLVCLADMPNVTPSHLERLLAAPDGMAVATAIEGRMGPPALFPRPLLSPLTRLSGDRGARELLADAFPILAEPALGRDYDTLADFD